MSITKKLNLILVLTVEYLQCCSVRTAWGGVVAPSPLLDLAATQIWYKELGYKPSKMY